MLGARGRIGVDYLDPAGVIAMDRTVYSVAGFEGLSDRLAILEVGPDLRSVGQSPLRGSILRAG